MTSILGDKGAVNSNPFVRSIASAAQGYRYTGKMCTGTQVKCVQVHGSNVYRYTGQMSTGTQVTCLQVHRSNVYRYTGKMCTGTQVKCVQVHR